MSITELSTEVQIAVNLFCFVAGAVVGVLFGGGRNGNHA